jgi:hypothetical protein
VSKQGPAHERNKTSKTAGAEKIRLLGLSANFLCCGGAEHALKNSHTKKQWRKDRKATRRAHSHDMRGTGVREANGYARAFMNECAVCVAAMNECAICVAAVLNPFLSLFLDKMLHPAPVRNECSICHLRLPPTHGSYRNLYRK